MTRIALYDHFKYPYDRISWPCRMWSLESLLHRFNWIPELYPSYPRAFKTMLDNVLAFLSPWFRHRRNMMHTFANKNDSKLLDWNRNKVCVRTRDENQEYYELQSRLLGARLCKTVYVGKDGKHENLFLLQAAAFMGAPSDEWSGLTQKTETVCETKLCLTKRQCQAFLDEMVAKTANLDWWEPDGEKGDENAQ